MSSFNFFEIKNIRENFPKFIVKTDLEKHKRLSKKYNCSVFLKREDKQEVRSYKIRGAYNAIFNLAKSKREKGVVCASAGNHAQGFSYACFLFKIKGYVFMPKTTPSQKIDATKKFGKNYVKIIVVGDTFDDSQNEAMKFCKKNKLEFIPPFNNINTIKGQATVGTEIIEDFKKSFPNKKIDYLFCPIGGGGIISGVSEVLKKEDSNIKIIGCEPKGAPSAFESLKKNKNITLENIDTFVDGASVKKLGDLNFPFIKKNVSKVNLVDENRLCSSILEFLKEDGIVVEPAGILSIDSLKDYKKEIKNKNVVCILSGSNFDFERLNEIKERSLKYEGLKKYLLVNFPQRAGALKEFLDLFGEDDDIERFEYLKKTKKEKGPAIVGIKTTNKNNFEKLFKKLKKENFDFKDITDDDMFFSFIV